MAGLKVSKKAPERNRIKRRLREIVRAHLKELKTGYDVMIMGLKPGLGAEYVELERQLLVVLKKAGLLK